MGNIDVIYSPDTILPVPQCLLDQDDNEAKQKNLMLIVK